MRRHITHLEAFPAKATKQSQSGGIRGAKLSEIQVGRARIGSYELFKLLDLLGRQTTLQANATDVPLLFYDPESNGHEPAPLSPPPPLRVSCQGLEMGLNNLDSNTEER